MLVVSLAGTERGWAKHGRKIIRLGDLNSPLLLQNLLEQVGGPPPFSNGFAVGGGRLDSNKSATSGPESTIKQPKIHEHSACSCIQTHMNIQSHRAPTTMQNPWF